jgi:hypothetical protein
MNKPISHGTRRAKDNIAGAGSRNGATRRIADLANRNQIALRG